ncbi:MAG: hypothetical protein U1E73_04965 [Planctomycetota bacterium]
MELDDLKDAWTRHGEHVARGDAEGPRRRRARLRLVPGLFVRGVEVAAGTALALAVGALLVRHLGELRYLVAGGAVFAWCAWATAASARLGIAGLRVDFAAPIADVQRALAAAQLAEARAVVLAVAGGVLAWLPALLLLFEAVTGVPALGRVDPAYLIANLAVGALVLAAGHRFARRCLDADLRPWARALVDALSGAGIRRARAELAELAAAGD